jgi:transposase
MLRTERLPRQTALLKLNHQPLRLNPAPATPHYNPDRFTHATSPSQPHYSEKVGLLPRVRFNSKGKAKKMTKATRKKYTLEFKQEAVRLVDSGQGLASAARTLGVVEQTLSNWVKAHRGGTLKGASGKAQVSAEQMEISRLRAELARVTMERDILGKAMAYFAKGQK